MFTRCFIMAPRAIATGSRCGSCDVGRLAPKYPIGWRFLCRIVLTILTSSIRCLAGSRSQQAVEDEVIGPSCAVHLVLQNNAVTAARQTPPAVLSSKDPVDGIECLPRRQPHQAVGLDLQVAAAGSCTKEWSIRRFVPGFPRKNEFLRRVDRPLVEFEPAKAG